MEPTILGAGSYGQVSCRDGKAVKKFSKIHHIIQEYTAICAMTESNYIVHASFANFSNLELHMDLYDCSLRNWLSNNKITTTTRNIITKDILRGLIDLHDRGFAHGDIKPGNILIKNNPLSAVLGDCGFVSVAKYSKVERTAPAYREPVIGYDITHDIFSFGICLFELVTGERVGVQKSYVAAQNVIKNKIKPGNDHYKNIILSSIQESKEKRPTARDLLFLLHKESYPMSVAKKYTTYPNEQSSKIGESNELRILIKYTCSHYKINRSKIGYYAIMEYLHRKKIDIEYYHLYMGTTLLILASLFGSSIFKEKDIIHLCQNKYTKIHIYKILHKLLQDDIFLNNLLQPS